MDQTSIARDLDSASQHQRQSIIRVEMTSPVQATVADKTPGLVVNFLIIGGGISGLSCAVALRRVGHNVTVLEADSYHSANNASSTHRLCPNGSRILYEWGYKEELDHNCSRSDGVMLLDYKNGERLAKHIWSEEVLQEMDGNWIHLSHVNLRRLLLRAAAALGAEIYFSQRIACIDTVKRVVTLTSGDVFCADVIIGADGVDNATKMHFPYTKAFDSVLGSLTLYQTTLSKKMLGDDSELLRFFRPGDDGVLYTHMWLGNGRCAILYPVDSEEQLGVKLFVPSEAKKDMSGSRDIFIASMGDIDPSLRQIIELGMPATATKLTGYHVPEDWVHESRRLILVGEAAHPLYHGSQGPSLSLEDGAVLGRLFSKLSSEDQISRFLSAFQDLRTSRFNAISASELNELVYMTLPPGGKQAQRDAFLRQQDAAGRNILTPDEKDASSAALKRWDKIKFLYGYNCENEADNWWVQWGLLAMRAKGIDLRTEISINCKC